MSLFKLSITGEVSVEPCESIRKYYNWCILILGPTGAGKSSFIEALAGKDQSLGISKDQLAGFTQQITAYEVKNAELRFVNDNPWLIYFIDTPGFSDSKMSEIEIISKVKQWMSDQCVWWINGVLYLSPITDTRAPGSKLRIINMIQSLLFDDAFTGLHILTTMWDQVGNPQAKRRAEANFAQLRDEIWKGPISNGATISRFHNNHESAIQILQDLVKSGGPYSVLGNESIKPEHPSAPILYQQLLYRISNAQQSADYLRQEKIHLILKPDPRLESIVLQRLSEVKEDLVKFLGQLVEFGTPPPGFEGVPERCIYQSLLNHVNEAREEQVALSDTLAGLGTSPDPAREATLRTQLDLIERELAQHVTRLVETGNPPEGYEKALEDALAPTTRSGDVLRSASPTSKNPLTTTVSDPIEKIAQTLTRSVKHLSLVTGSPPQNTATSAHPDPFSSDAVPSADHAAAALYATKLLAFGEHPEGSVSPKGSSKDRFKKGFRSLKEKFPFLSTSERRG